MYFDVGLYPQRNLPMRRFYIETRWATISVYAVYECIPPICIYIYILCQIIEQRHKIVLLYFFVCVILQSTHF